MKTHMLTIQNMRKKSKALSQTCFPHTKGMTERGIVLVVVMVLAAVTLIIMTSLIYMITSSTQMSGMQKQYKTALGSGLGGRDLMLQVISIRGDTVAMNNLAGNIASLNPVTTITSACTGTYNGITYHGLQAKIMTPSSNWSGCNESLTINANDSSTYDMSFDMGTSPKYKVYAKIVDTVNGNSGGGAGLMANGVVSNSGDVPVMAVPYLYTLEVSAENSTNHAERAKLSILYQY